MKPSQSRALRIHGRTLLLTAILLAAAILVNLCLSLLPETLLNPDLSGKETFKISATTKKHIEKLKEPVTLWYLVEGGRAQADGDIYAFLSQYEDAADAIDVKIVNLSHAEEFLAERGFSGAENMSILVESDRRCKLIDSSELYYYRFYNSSVGELLLSVKDYAALLYNLSLSEDGASTLAQIMAGMEAKFNGESRVTNAINYVTMEKTATLAVLLGNGCSFVDSSLERILDQSSYDWRETAALTALPENCDLLLMHAPTADLTADEQTALEAYLADGGSLLLTTSYDISSEKTNAENLPNLAALLSNWGMGFSSERHILCEGSSNYCLGSSSASYPNVFYARVDSAHPATGLFDGQFVVSNAHAILLTETDGVTHSPWLYTSDAGYLADKNQKEVGDRTSYPLGVTATRGEGCILWLSCAESLGVSANDSSAGGNYALLQSAISYLSGVEGETISTPSRTIDTSTLSVTPGGFVFWGIITVILLPGIAVGLGIWLHYTRKKR